MANKFSCALCVVRLLTGGATSTISQVVNLLYIGCRLAISFVGHRQTIMFFTNVVDCDVTENFSKWISDQGGWVSRSTARLSKSLLLSGGFTRWRCHNYSLNQFKKHVKTF